MIPVGERDASVVRKRAKSGAIIAALGAICGPGSVQSNCGSGRWLKALASQVSIGYL